MILKFFACMCVCVRAMQLSRNAARLIDSWIERICFFYVCSVQTRGYEDAEEFSEAADRSV